MTRQGSSEPLNYPEGDPEQRHSLEFYAKAEAKAREAEHWAEHWAEVAALNCNWGYTLRYSGQIDAAREKQEASAGAHRLANSPEIDVLDRELEVLTCVAIKEGWSWESIKAMEAGLTKIEDWHRRAEIGETVPEAPDHQSRLRALANALSNAIGAATANDHWQEVMVRQTRWLMIARQLGTDELKLATTRFNRAMVLCYYLQRYGEAQAELENLLELFQAAGDQSMLSKTLFALARMADEGLIEI